MTAVISKEKYNTSRGLTFILENSPSIKVGEMLLVDDVLVKIEEIIFPSRPTENNLIAITVKECNNG